MEMRICPVCGIAFEPRIHNQKYCKKACKWSSSNTRRRPGKAMNTCLGCGKQFQPFHRDTKYCNRDCYRQSPAYLESRVISQAKSNQSEKRKLWNYTYVRSESRRAYGRNYNKSERHKIANRAWKARHRAELSAQASNNCKNLADPYVRRLLTYGTSLTAKDFPPDLVEIKRQQLKLKRTLNEKHE